MIVHGEIIPPAALRAGRDSMRGEFTRDTVFEAMSAANAPWSTLGEASRRLIRKAQEAGLIHPISTNRFKGIDP